MNDIEKIKAAALAAIDDLDDYARMECSVEAIGAMTYLTNFVKTVCDRLESAERDAARYLKAIVDHRKGDLLCISRVQSEEFCKTADDADWDEIDHEKIMAELELNRIADEAMKEKP